MARCALHPGRNAVTTIFGTNYCLICQKGMTAARGRVDVHVQPKECFIWYVSNDNWQPVVGTGCAHWVSHELNIRKGTVGDRCLAGFTYRVPVVVHSRKKLAGIGEVQVNDIWASPSLDHMGLVIKVTPPVQASGTPTLTIRHDSSRQGKVAENDFATYFGGKGNFYR